MTSQEAYELNRAQSSPCHLGPAEEPWAGRKVATSSKIPASEQKNSTLENHESIPLVRNHASFNEHLTNLRYSNLILVDRSHYPQTTYQRERSIKTKVTYTILARGNTSICICACFLRSIKMKNWSIFNRVATCSQKVADTSSLFIYSLSADTNSMFTCSLSFLLWW